MSLKVAFYSPYLPKSFGGGEKHLLEVARLVASRHQVVVAVSQDQILDADKHRVLAQVKARYERFLGQSLAGVSFTTTPLGSQASFWKKLLWTSRFDYLYYATDGSLFFSLARTNNLHIQVPLKLDKSSWIEKLKLGNWSFKNTNSNFTKKVIEEYWNTKVTHVHYPLTRIDELLLTKEQLANKSKLILHVGRFFTGLHDKRQDVLIEIFEEMLCKHPEEMKDWRLGFVGSVEDQASLEKLQNQAAHLPVDWYPDATRDKLTELLKQAAVYWHATGFGLDESEHPEKMEHFGISTVEAMASGAIPVVIGKGGQIEIMGSDLKELLWQTKKECLQTTLKVITNHQEARRWQDLAIQRAGHFGQKQFEKTLWQMF